MNNQQTNQICTNTIEHGHAFFFFSGNTLEKNVHNSYINHMQPMGDLTCTDVHTRMLPPSSVIHSSFFF